jgi:PAS domain S-box-containing protein
MTRLLIVDDNPQSLYLLQVLLSANGFELDLASNGAEALEQARRAPPDMIISDVLMPVMDGFALCRACKQDERLKDIPFVFYTATYTDPKDKEFALSLGAERFIVKPLEPAKFLALLRETIESHAAGKLVAPCEPIAEEAEYYKQYNSALIRKLENKVMQLEEANHALELDITERKRAEEALAVEHTLLRAIVDILPALVYAKDTACRKILANHVDLEYMGASTEAEALGKTDFDFYPEDMAARFYARDQAIIQTGQPLIDYEHSIVTADGQQRWLLTSKMPLRDSGGQVIGLVGVGLDITERKWAEEALQVSERRYRNIINGMIDTAWVVDFDASIIDVNNAAVEVSGYSREELLSMKIPDIDHNLKSEEIKGLASRMPTDKIQTFESWHTTKDGRKIPVEIYSSLITYGDKQAILSIARDIAERKRAEAQLGEQLDELRRWHQVTLGRETRILDLKREVNELLAQAGRPPRYPSAEDPKGL